MVEKDDLRVDEELAPDLLVAQLGVVVVSDGPVRPGETHRCGWYAFEGRVLSRTEGG